MDLLDALIPYVLTFGHNVDHLNLDIDLGEDIEVLLVEDEANTDFCYILNNNNQIAFGGPKDMGMPLWVMLDCAILPTAMIGFMAHSDSIDDEMWEILELEDDYEGMVPISEYCAALAMEPGCVSGFSLHSVVPGHGIATRTKALALAVLGATKQVGVTQFNNPAIRVHARFGPMQILVHRPPVHTHPQDSFVYHLNLPEQDMLLEMARGGAVFGVPDRPAGIKWSFDPDSEQDHLRLATHLGRKKKAWIVSPGWRGTTDGNEIDMILGE